MVSGVGFFSHVAFGTQKSLNDWLCRTNLPIDSPSRTAAYAFKPCSWARLIAALLFCQRGLRVAEPSRGLGRTTRRCGGQTVHFERRVKTTTWGIGATQRNVRVRN